MDAWKGRNSSCESRIAGMQGIEMNPNQKKIDYDDIGLKCGIEIHQQLKTSRKLFCRCPAVLTTKDPDLIVQRNFRPVLGEMGVFDEAMLLEFKKRMNVLYQVYNDINCTYELDDTPPFECDPEAIEIALLLAKSLNMTIVDEFKVCRKNYLDGSVPAGFQRTMIIAMDGYYELSNGKKIGIEILCLEEDSARRISQEGKNITFRLDRLGIPLVEIATAPDIHDPLEAMEAASRLGLLLRATGKVRRGLGVTRQDINVSIKGGERIEIKGVQKLEYMPDLVRFEAIRQIKLLELKKEMDKRGITRKIVDSISSKGDDVTKLVKVEEKPNFFKNALKSGKHLYGTRIPKMGGLLGMELQPNHRFGTELSDRVKILVGLNGIIHSDEDLGGTYKITRDEQEKIVDALHVGEKDAYILLLCTEEEAARSFQFIKERVEMALHGVPPETRKALEDGTTQFLRGLHGGSRLYPDTDSRSIPIGADLVEAIEVPPVPWEITKELSRKHDLDEQRVQQMILDGFLSLFQDIIKDINIAPSLVLNTLLDTITALRRDGFLIDDIPDERFIELFSIIASGDASKEAIDEILMESSKKPEEPVKVIIKTLHITSMKRDELKQIIANIIIENQDLIKEKGDRAFSPLMGSVMKEARGKIDGKIVAEELRKALASNK
ncbi:Glu-tRNA(Gln) amidotransferase subunit GatE [Candidatus Bathyarchaeota archaeon]|nr:Glu-tRNA(Gln) amidotransferase subunit GatE [Candidatus Bathyarchaeota archaeon]